MSNNVYSEINLHFVWHVKQSQPLITDAIEPGLYRFLRSYSLKTDGLIFHEVGGTETHVHIAVTIPPTLTISEWIGKLKGASSHHVNHELANRKLLDWQRGYGVVSIGTKDLQWVINYIRNQNEHPPREQQSSGSRRLRMKTMAKADSSKQAKARYIINVAFCFMPPLTQR